MDHFSQKLVIEKEMFEGLNVLGVEIYFEVKNALKKEKLCNTL